jgi:hypothetical protein
MNKQELKQIIKEEINKVISEANQSYKLKELMSIDSKGELIDDEDDDEDEPTPEEIEHLKKLGFDIQIIKDEDVHWYWQASNGNFAGGSSENPKRIVELPVRSKEARINYINCILRHDNLWLKKRPKEKTNYKDQDLFDEAKYYFVNKEGNIIALKDTLDELIEEVKKNPNKFINSMLKNS